jgi:outer membrane murein-binding lipoprotein Lpp
MELDTTSTDAMHWAENLVATAKENNFTMEQVLDESWLVAWFANYWAAVYDPLKSEVDQLRAEVEQLQTDNQQLRDALEEAERFVAKVNNDRNDLGDVHLELLIRQALKGVE